MIDIQLQALAKRYKWEWIFKDINIHFQAGEAYAILGQNGAGKSTFLQLISGYLSPSLGQIDFTYQGKSIEREERYRYAAMAAPYTALIEEFTLIEVLDFQSKFKNWLPNLDRKAILELLQFAKINWHKPLKYFSSGMRQRVKLALAILSDAPLLLLDEPTITLDVQGAEWFYQLLVQYQYLDAAQSQKRTIIIASNVEADFKICNERLDLLNYKKFN